MKTNNGFNKSLQIMARQLEKATEPLRQQAKRLEEATEPIRRYSRQLEGITEPLRTIAKRLQYIRGLRADKYEHCDHSSRTGCKLIKRTADAYYFSRLKLRPYTMQTREEFQQEAFLAMLQNKDKYQGEEPEAFIRQIIKEHFNELFKAAWRKDRAIDNNKFRGKIKYINPGICSIIAVVFNTWNIDLMLTAYIKNKGTGAKGDYSTFTFLSEQDKAYLQAELLQDMQQAVNQLPDLQRDIIKLYYLQGEKIKDICRLLHISTAREQRTRREALTALKAQLFESSEHEQTAPVNIKPKVYIYRTPESQQTFKQPTLPLTGLFNCSRRSLLITFKRRIYKSISIDNYFNGNEQHKKNA